MRAIIPDRRQSPTFEDDTPDLEHRVRRLCWIIVRCWPALFQDQPSLVVKREHALEGKARGMLITEILVTKNEAPAAAPKTGTYGLATMSRDEDRPVEPVRRGLALTLLRTVAPAELVVGLPSLQPHLLEAKCRRVLSDDQFMASNLLRFDSHPAPTQVWRSLTSDEHQWGRYEDHWEQPDAPHRFLHVHRPRHLTRDTLTQGRVNSPRPMGQFRLRNGPLVAGV